MNRSKQKGDRFEREIVNAMQDAGLAALRIPLSGSMTGFKGDITCPVQGEDWKFECKSRATGFAFLYQNLDGNKALVVKADRAEPLVVLRASDFYKLAVLS